MDTSKNTKSVCSSSLVLKQSSVSFLVEDSVATVEASDDTVVARGVIFAAV